MRSETFELPDSDEKCGRRSPDGSVAVTSSVEGAAEMSSPDASRALSLDDVAEPSTRTESGRGFRGLNFFRRFAKDSKDRDGSSETGRPEKKRGFSLWRRDHSKSKKERAGPPDGVVKSATLPSDVSLRASRSSESVPAARGVPCSATADALVSAGGSSRRVSDVSSSDLDPSAGPSPEGPSFRSEDRSNEVPSDLDSDSPRRLLNCTSIVTTV